MRNCQPSRQGRGIDRDALKALRQADGASDEKRAMVSAFNSSLGALGECGRKFDDQG